MSETTPQPSSLTPTSHLNEREAQIREDDGSKEDKSLHVRFIQDIPLQLTVELGRKRLLIQELLQLHQGAVIELTKHIEEPCEILVNNKLVGHGEVVIINDKFGVRITNIISLPDSAQPSP